jgi:hypothetical protein
LSHEKKRLNALRVRSVGGLVEQELAKVSFLAPKEFIEVPDESDVISEASENTVRGYHVKVTYNAVSECEKHTTQTPLRK